METVHLLTIKNLVPPQRAQSSELLRTVRVIIVNVNVMEEIAMIGEATGITAVTEGPIMTVTIGEIIMDVQEIKEDDIRFSMINKEYIHLF
jgi:hypothetical protein